MLRLEDRLRVAMSADMGCQLTAGEVKQVARWLVTLRRIGTRPDGRGNSAAALNALKGMEG